MKRAGLEAYLRASRASRRVDPEPLAERPSLRVDGEQVRWFRLRAMGLVDPAPAGDYVRAAYAGLQDSAPRSALYSLHARAEGVGPTTWEHPSLVQIWLRWADYVVPRADVAIFTVGALPRDREQAAALQDLAAAVVAALDAKPRTALEVSRALRSFERRDLLVRATAVTGRVHIRWDARTTVLLAQGPPDLEPEAARLALARRFLHWHGPAGPGHFARWAGVPRRDAFETFAALRGELVPVDFAGRARHLLATDEQALLTTARPDGVRLLPFNEPYLYLDADLVHHNPGLAPAQVSPTVSRRLPNSLGGRILVDGELVGSWGRVQANVTLATWAPLSPRDVERVVAEVERLAGPLGRPPRWQWL